jgi:predicted N-acetyltransferase YhbS
MEVVSKKTSEFIVRRSQESDFKNIYEFHFNHGQIPLPGYLQNVLECFVGISLVAYEEEKLLGHILVMPLSSQQNIEVEEAAVIAGIWTDEANVAEILVREAMMCAWESGFHALFSLENYPRIRKAGFKSVDRNYFASNIDLQGVWGVELSWDGLNIIRKGLTLPKVYLSQANKWKHFFNN